MGSFLPPPVLTRKSAHFANVTTRHYTAHMPSAFELAPGDVVLVEPGDVRTIHHVTNTSVDAYALAQITFADGRLMLVLPTRHFVRLHPLAPTSPSTPISPTPTPEDAPE